MKFKLVEDYTDYGYVSNNIEVASDNSDEQVDIDNEDKYNSTSIFSPYNYYIITIEGKPQQKIRAKNKKDAAIKCRKNYKDKIKILGIKEI